MARGPAQNENGWAEMDNSGRLPALIYNSVFPDVFRLLGSLCRGFGTGRPAGLHVRLEPARSPRMSHGTGGTALTYQGGIPPETIHACVGGNWEFRRLLILNIMAP